MRLFLLLLLFFFPQIIWAEAVPKVVQSPINQTEAEEPQVGKAQANQVQANQANANQVKTPLNEQSKILSPQNKLEKATEKVSLNVNKTDAPEVGKHLPRSMDAMTMILSLLMVLALIVGLGVVLKRFQPKSQGLKGLKIITSLHLGTKERLVVVEVADKQLLLGITSQQITLLQSLETAINPDEPIAGQLGESMLSFFKK